MEFTLANKEILIKFLAEEGVLKSPWLAEAMKIVDRKDFVLSEHYALAYENIPLSIGEGQTISQPYTVVFMLELLQPDAGDHIVDVGHGSGWQTALIAEMVGEEGKVYAIEVLPPLCRFGKSNVEKYPQYKDRVEFYCQNAEHCLPEVAEKIGGFDGIVAAAEVMEVPAAWREQLKLGGKIIYPKQGALYREIKHGTGYFAVQKFPGFSFVPFRGA